MDCLFSTVPQEAPNITQVTAPDETSVLITWQGIPLERFAGAPQGYLVLYREHMSALEYQHVAVHGLVNFTRMKGLRANTTYEMRLLAVNVFAHGPLSDPVSVKTQPVSK